jgi:hypothetical protein
MSEETAPKTIYLQWDGLDDGATWCADRINDEDVEYIQAAELAALESDSARYLSRIEELTEQCNKFYAQTKDAATVLKLCRPLVQNDVYELENESVCFYCGEEIDSGDEHKADCQQLVAYLAICAYFGKYNEELKIKCTCPCIDCIEGKHCGGEYWWPPEPVEHENGIVEEPQLIGVCEHLVLDDIGDFDDRSEIDDDDNGYLECEQEGWAE